MVRGWFLRVCAAVLLVPALVVNYEKNRGSPVVWDWFRVGSGLGHRRFAVAFLLVHSSFAAVGRVLPSWFLIALQKLRGRSGAGSRLGLGWFRAGSGPARGRFRVGSLLVLGWFGLIDSRFAFALRASPSPIPKEKAMTFTTYVGVARGEPPPRTSTRQAVNPLRTHED